MCLVAGDVLLISWWRRCLPGLSTVMSLSFHLSLINIWGIYSEMMGDPFFVKFLPANFNIR